MRAVARRAAPAASGTGVLGGAWRGSWGWLIAASAIPVVLLVDASSKVRRRS